MTCSQYNKKTLRVDHSIDLEKGKYKKCEMNTEPSLVCKIMILTEVGSFKHWSLHGQCQSTFDGRTYAKKSFLRHSSFFLSALK